MAADAVMPRGLRAVVFDLDGTLLDTLADLSTAVNHALRMHGMPERTLGEVRAFVGNGVRRLMERSVPEGIGAEAFEQVFDCFKRYYVAHCEEQTRLYDGVPAMLLELKARGYRMAIVSNKLQAGVTELYHHYFADTVDVAIGESAGMRRKPAPDMVERALAALQVSREEAVYVGDSDVDLATAHAVGLPCVSVLWGFRDEDFLREHGATLFAHHPTDIPSLLQPWHATSH